MVFDLFIYLFVGPYSSVNCHTLEGSTKSCKRYSTSMTIGVFMYDDYMPLRRDSILLAIGTST